MVTVIDPRQTTPTPPSPTQFTRLCDPSNADLIQMLRLRGRGELCDKYSQHNVCKMPAWCILGLSEPNGDAATMAAVIGSTAFIMPATLPIPYAKRYRDVGGGRQYFLWTIESKGRRHDHHPCLETIVRITTTEPEARILAPAWFSQLKPITAIPWTPYLVTILYALGMPRDSLVDIVTETTFVITLSAVEWLRSRRYTPNVRQLDSENSGLIRLSRAPFPAFIVGNEVAPIAETCLDHLTSYWASECRTRDTTTTTTAASSAATTLPCVHMTDACPFVNALLEKAARGGPWVCGAGFDRLCRLSTTQQHEQQPAAFFSLLHDVLWSGKRFLFNSLGDVSSTNEAVDTRPTFQKLRDLVRPSTGKLPLLLSCSLGGSGEFVEVDSLTVEIHTRIVPIDTHERELMILEAVVRTLL
jgi:hypothetical protein